MPAKGTVTRPWQKTIDFVDGLKGKLPDEELAVIERYVEKRSREAAQIQVTVTQVDTVQHSSPYPFDPEPLPSVYVELENVGGKMGPELKEFESPSAGTGLETPGQQCPSNEGTWETGRTTAAGFLTTAVDSNQGGNFFSTTTESVDTRTSEKSKKITADTTFLQQGHTPRSEENKQFDSRWKRREGPALERGCNSTSFFWGELEGSLLAFCLCFVLCTLCVLCFPKLFFYPGDHFSAKLKDIRGDVDQVAEVRNRRASIFSSITLLKMARTSNTRFGRSANALG